MTREEWYNLPSMTEAEMRSLADWTPAVTAESILAAVKAIPLPVDQCFAIPGTYDEVVAMLIANGARYDEHHSPRPRMLATPEAGFAGLYWFAIVEDAPRRRVLIGDYKAIEKEINEAAAREFAAFQENMAAMRNLESKGMVTFDDQKKWLDADGKPLDDGYAKLLDGMLDDDPQPDRIVE